MILYQVHKYNFSSLSEYKFIYHIPMFQALRQANRRHSARAKNQKTFVRNHFCIFPTMSSNMTQFSLIIILCITPCNISYIPIHHTMQYIMCDNVTNLIFGLYVFPISMVHICSHQLGIILQLNKYLISTYILDIYISIVERLQLMQGTSLFPLE